MIETSIIIVHHNRLNYLLQQLNEYGKWPAKDSFEFIVVDNFSITEKDKAKLNEYFFWVKFIFLKTNNGPSHARNIGLKISSGKYVQFIDDDDLITFKKVYSQTCYLSSNRMIDIVIGPSQRCDWNLNTLPLELSQHSHLPFFEEVRSCYDLVSTNGFFPVASALFTKEILVSIGGFTENRWLIEDVDLYLRLYQNGAKFKVDKNLSFGFFWRTGEQQKSLSKSNRKEFLEGCLLNFFYCIDNDLLLTNADHELIYTSIFNLLKQDVSVNKALYTKGVNAIKKQPLKYLPRYAVFARIIGFDKLFKVASIYRKAKNIPQQR